MFRGQGCCFSDLDKGATWARVPAELFQLFGNSNLNQTHMHFCEPGDLQSYPELGITECALEERGQMLVASYCFFREDLVASLTGRYFSGSSYNNSWKRTLTC